MAKETGAQKETVERVMHEFKHGKLKGAGGRKVTNPKQAVAIGLSEAGASNRQSPKESRDRRKGDKSSGRRGAEGGRSKAELYAEAKTRDIPGRSRMSKPELERALRG